jgi:iron complex outermembrane receptor protein
VAREFTTAEFVQRIQVIARGRSQERRYGGAQRLGLPPAPFGESLYVDRLNFDFSPQTDDKVRQWSLGLGYQAEHAGFGQISAGIQKVDYRKLVTTPSGPRPTSRDKPWLVNVAATANITRNISLFGSYTRGLEESEVAPEIAINRDEAPPALRTKQIDIGLKTKIGPITLITGAFDIQRPYYGVDGESVFRRLGAVQHRGLEVSMTGSPAPGLTLVAGGTFIRARLSGDEVASGAIGSRPVDVPARKLVASLDWRPSGSATSFDVAVEHIGPNTGDALNRVRVDPFTTVDAGVRHKLKLGTATAVLRLQATNLFDAFGWEVAGNNAFVYIQSRQVIARFAIDF